MNMKYQVDDCTEWSTSVRVPSPPPPGTRWLLWDTIRTDTGKSTDYNRNVVLELTSFKRTYVHFCPFVSPTISIKATSLAAVILELFPF